MFLRLLVLEAPIAAGFAGQAEAHLNACSAALLAMKMLFPDWVEAVRRLGVGPRANQRRLGSRSMPVATVHSRLAPTNLCLSLSLGLT